MNVAADGVRLIAEDKTECLFDLAEILLRIDADQGSGGTVLFT